MVENRARESAKIIPETGYFLSEMISDLIDSPPTSPPETMSNFKLKDCLKAAQSDNKEAKRSKQKKELSCKAKYKSSESEDKDRARKRDRRKPGREKLVGSSQDKSTAVGVKEQSPKKLDKFKKDERRYEETIIDNIVISAFKSWEDLQDEVNERISSYIVQDKESNQESIPQNDFDREGSTSQTGVQLQDSQSNIHRKPYDTREERFEQFSNEATQQNAALLQPHQTTKSQLASSFSQQNHDHKPKHLRERDHASLSRTRSSSELQPQDTVGIAANIDPPRVMEWIPVRDLSAKSIPIDRVYSDIARSIGPHHPSVPFPAQNGHRFNPPLDVTRRELDTQFNRAKHKQLFGPSPLHPYDHSHPLGNAFHRNSSAPIGPQMSSANQYLQDYLGPNPYNQHMRNSNPYALPAPSQPLFAPHTPFPAPSSLTGPYASPFTITDTIISRQTIIPPSMGAGRFGHLPGPLNAIEHGSPSMVKYPSYVPSPTERSFMEFARSYANANSISGFMNQPMSSGLYPSGSSFNPGFERFLAEQRAMAGPGAHSSLHINDPTTRLGAPNYHNEARSGINPPASFYPHFFR